MQPDRSMGRGRIGFAIVVALSLAAPRAAGAGEPAPTRLLAQQPTQPINSVKPGARPVRKAEPRYYHGVDIFLMPRFRDHVFQVARQTQQGDIDGAQRRIASLIAQYGDAPDLHVLAATLAGFKGDKATAAAALDRAVTLGFSDVFSLLTRPPLNRFANDPKIAEIAARTPGEPVGSTAEPPRVRRVSRGVALVDAANTAWDPKSQRLTPFFHMPKNLRRLPLYFDRKTGPLASLEVLVAKGLAAGNAGDLYDNRDAGHSILPSKADRPTQLTHIRYGPDAVAGGVHYGLNTALLYDNVVFGNSSTAVGRDRWRSLPRLAMTTPGGVQDLWRLYAGNHLYVFPEDRDHDPVNNHAGVGDAFPGYVPYVVVSQGSSHSDLPFLEAIQAILAAFRPDTKAFLREKKLIAPTVQHVLRSTLKSARGPDAFFGPFAHPTVFQKEDIDLSAAIGAANSLRPADTPPIATIRMLEEPQLTSGVSFFADGMSETLYTTPAAIARVWRGVESRRRYLLQAAADDPNGRKVKYRWKILRGDPKRIRIKPRTVDGSVAEVVIDWHPPAPTPERPAVKGHRVDVAVFADNGARISMPAILSVAFPHHQIRAYENGPTGLRIASIDYRKYAKRPERVYADPFIWPDRNWRDVYRYDAAGRPLGWSRFRKAVKTDFLADGRRLETPDGGGAARPEPVVYRLTARPKQVDYAVEEALAKP